MIKRLFICSLITIHNIVKDFNKMLGKITQFKLHSMVLESRDVMGNLVDFIPISFNLKNKPIQPYYSYLGFTGTKRLGQPPYYMHTIYLKIFQRGGSYSSLLEILQGIFWIQGCHLLSLMTLIGIIPLIEMRIAINFQQQGLLIISLE